MTPQERVELANVALKALAAVTDQPPAADNDGDRMLWQACNEAWEDVNETLEAIATGEV